MYHRGSFPKSNAHPIKGIQPFSIGGRFALDPVFHSRCERKYNNNKRRTGNKKLLIIDRSMAAVILAAWRFENTCHTVKVIQATPTNHAILFIQCHLFSDQKMNINIFFSKIKHFLILSKWPVVTVYFKIVFHRSRVKTSLSM